MRTNRHQSKVQQEGVKGYSGGMGCAEGSLDHHDLPLNEAIQLGVVCGRHVICLMQFFSSFWVNSFNKKGGSSSVRSPLGGLYCETKSCRGLGYLCFDSVDERILAEGITNQEVVFPIVVKIICYVLPQGIMYVSG